MVPTLCPPAQQLHRPSCRGPIAGTAASRNIKRILSEDNMQLASLRYLRQLCAHQAKGFATQSRNQLLKAGTSLESLAAEPLKEEPQQHREADLELIRRHNSSLKQIKGQTIGARIFRVDKRFIFLDTGFNKHVKFSRKALLLSQLVSSIDGGMRTSPEDFRVGDVLKFVVEETETPYGDMQLLSERQLAADKSVQVWNTIRQAMRQNESIMGRVLNSVPGGYCIGVAGLVAFCPFSAIAGSTARRIGVLQPFLVLRMEEDRQNIILYDAQKRPPPLRSSSRRDEGIASTQSCKLPACQPCSRAPTASCMSVMKQQPVAGSRLMGGSRFYGAVVALVMVLCQLYACTSTQHANRLRGMSSACHVTIYWLSCRADQQQIPGKIE